MVDEHPWHRALARLPGARWICDAGLVAVVTGSPFAGFNAVVHVDGAAGTERAARLLRAGAWTRRSIGEERDELDRRLLGDGFHEASMTAWTGALDVVATGVATTGVVWVREPAEVGACADLMAEVFAVPEAVRAEFRGVHLALAVGEDPPWRVFALREWGAWVATCVLASAGEVAEIHALATSPVARGGRRAARVVAAALAFARAAGCRRLVAQTTPGGAAVATSLGLVRSGVVRLLHRA